jgi:glycerol-3-phosphate dehydrogenase, anaerobic, B subunit
MKFDTVIIGGGLSGLVCGIRLLQQGQRCAIISSGQSALHFSSGSFDLLNTLPNGESVDNPLISIKSLVKQAPDHPYTKIGEDDFGNITDEAEHFFKEIHVKLIGTASKNHYRVTPMGIMKPTWLTMYGFTTIENQIELPWKKVSIFNISGFLDFYPQFIADEFLKKGTESEIHLINLTSLDSLRKNPSEMRSTNISRVLDKNIQELSKILNEKSGDSDAIIFPACIGLETDSMDKLRKSVDRPIFLIPTMPPSIAGIHTQQYLHDYFLKSGGVYMLGDSIKKADVENNRVARVYSFNHGDIPFTADNFVLATGSYFSQGLIATSDNIYEPVFSLDVSYSQDRKDWYSPKLFEKQGYQDYGVKTDNSFRGIRKGETMENLFVTGAILEGFSPIKEGCGAGVSILTSLAVARTIAKNKKG